MVAVVCCMLFLYSIDVLYALLTADKRSTITPVHQPQVAMKIWKCKRKDYTFWRQFNEKPCIIPGCPGNEGLCAASAGKYAAYHRQMQSVQARKC